ncbi:15049_t:CDS:2 [Dentiscutata erythropus]|uniref:15049_t:CDS:1 n=1 Tax=Dentiscutata erythropus TaxID=1348616 RepID=A0A9N8ZRQ6_9GLOM|nr:15049_t:CDS:2 [Dentiscutata erythropus]
MKNTNDERVILNVGGIKYETYRSTLTAYPKTLLGAMFQERNGAMLHPTNGNEYFFDRNGRAFHYIMEFYRTGENVWPGEDTLEQSYTLVSQQELIKEIDYFQIPINLGRAHTDIIPDSKTLASRLDEFVNALIDSIYDMRFEFLNNVTINFYNRKKVVEGDPSTMYSLWPYIETVQRRLKPFETSGSRMLDLFGDQIVAKLNSKENIKCTMKKYAYGTDLVFRFEQEFNTKEILSYCKELE